MLCNHNIALFQVQVPPSLLQPWITGLNHLTKDTHDQLT